MSIWSSLTALAGRVGLDGPLRSIVAAVSGQPPPSGIEREMGRLGDHRAATRKVTFTIGVIVLGAKMAKADGRVTRDEIAAFLQVFHIDEADKPAVARLFNTAKADSSGFEPYARQIARLFEPASPVLEELLGCLFHIAKADGTVDAAELDYLERVARLFGFDALAFERIRGEEMGVDAADPYTILGVARDASDEAVRAAWRALARDNHPDRLVADGMPSEFIEMATEKMATINAAFDRIARERGFA